MRAASSGPATSSGGGLAIRQVDVRPHHHRRSGRGPPQPVGVVGPLDDGGRRSDVGDDVVQLTLGIVDVDRDHDQSGPQGADVGHQGRDRRGGRPHHPVPRRQAGPLEPAGHPAGGLVELPGRPPPPPAGRSPGGAGPKGPGPPTTAGLRSGPPTRRPGPEQRPRRHEIAGGQRRAGGQMITPRKQAVLLAPVTGPVIAEIRTARPAGTDLVGRAGGPQP